MIENLAKYAPKLERPGVDAKRAGTALTVTFFKAFLKLPDVSKLRHLTFSGPSLSYHIISCFC